MEEEAARRLKKALEIEPDHPITTDTHVSYNYLKGGWVSLDSNSLNSRKPVHNSPR